MEKDTKNRIIKFRAKSVKCCVLWIKGYYSKMLYGGKLIDIISYDLEHEPIKVDTLCQFTGKTDKNKKEIYEGDILKYGRDGRLYVVKFFDGMFYASVEECNENIYGGFPLHVLTNEEDKYKCEVIGNIFDNKNYLKKNSHE